MRHDLHVLPDGEALARRGAQHVVAHALAAIHERGHFTFAVSGGHTPRAMFAELATLAMPWEKTTIYQVDERAAPDDDPERNLTHLLENLGNAPVRVEAMPVTDPNLDAAASRYAALLPARLDLVHLGIGTDGHTASLVPGDPVLEVDDRVVATTDEYRGHRRMTLTYPGLALADEVFWLVAGAEKGDALARLLRSDPSVPAGRVRAARSIVMADESVHAASLG